MEKGIKKVRDRKQSKVLQKKRLHHMSFQMFYHGMMLPGMLILLLFNYLPMFGLVMAFQDFKPTKGVLGSDWVGVRHYVTLFWGSNLWQLIRNTLAISLSKMVLNPLITISFAILLNEIRVKFLKKSVQTIVYLPHFLNWVILAAVVKGLFSADGTIVMLLAEMGIETGSWLSSNTLFRPMIIGSSIWKEFGYGSIVYLAAITAVDPQLHEAAAIDGAGWFKRVWHVTLPGMLPIILMQIIMNLSGILAAGFDQIYNLYSPVVYETADVLDTYIYRAGLVDRNYSFATAMGLINGTIGLTLMVSANAFCGKVLKRSVF